MAGAAERVRELVVVEQPDDRRGERRRVVRRDEEARDFSCAIISGIPPTLDATTGRESAIASRIVSPWASR